MTTVPSEHTIPPGGFHFMEGDVRIDGHSYPSVAENLLRYRIENKLPLGSPLEEVHRYVCSRWPHFCHQNSSPNPGHPNALPSLTSRVANWLAQLYRDARYIDISKNFVSPGLAEARAAICRSCPRNAEWKSGCGSCGAATIRVGFTYRAGRDVPGAEALLACDVLGQDNRTAVWLAQLPMMTAEQQHALPAQCWRKE